MKQRTRIQQEEKWAGSWSAYLQIIDLNPIMLIRYAQLHIKLNSFLQWRGNYFRTGGGKTESAKVGNAK